MNRSQPLNENAFYAHALSFIDEAFHLVEEHPKLVFLALSALYFATVLQRAWFRPLWHDELFTYYIAHTSSWARTWKLARSVDLNPPLSYFLTHAVFSVVPAIPFTCRIPSILGFLLASFGVFEVLRRELSTIYGVVGVLCLWWSPFLEYAGEARPYALMLGFTMMMILGWQGATREQPRSRSLWIIGIAGLGLLLTHALGLFAWGALLLAEATRTLIRRKFDWPLCSALMLPALSLLTYMRPMHRQGQGIYPPLFQASRAALSQFYFRALSPLLLPIILSVLLAAVWLVIRASHGKQQRVISFFPMAVLLAALLAVPAEVTALFMRSKSAWFDRYGIVAMIPIVLFPVLVLGWGTRRSRLAGTAMVLLLLMPPPRVRAATVGMLAQVLPPRMGGRIIAVLCPPPSLGRVAAEAVGLPGYLQASARQAPEIGGLAEFRSDLPLVAASGLTFLEMDNREEPKVAARLFYLTDPDAAARFAQANIFESFADLKQLFPIRAEVQPYRQFTSLHRQFLVIGSYGYPEDWLLRKAEADGANLRIIGKYNGGYKDSELYEVTMPSTPTREMGRGPASISKPAAAFSQTAHRDEPSSR